MASSRASFPNNAVEYFVSYYDYYQPEAYVPRSDTYIEKERRLTSRSTACATPRRARCWNATTSSSSQSVSCIYGIGSVETYHRDDVLAARGGKLDAAPADRRSRGASIPAHGVDFCRGIFRVRGDTVDIFPAHYEDRAWRVEPLWRRGRALSSNSIPLTGKKTHRSRICEDLRQLAIM